MVHQALTVPRPTHIDEVDENNSGQIPQRKLPGRFLRCLHIYLQDGLVHRFPAGEFPRIHINHRQRLRGLNDKIPAGFQPDLRRKGIPECRVQPVERRKRQGFILIEGKYLLPVRRLLQEETNNILPAVRPVCHNALRIPEISPDQPDIFRFRLPKKSSRPAGLCLFQHIPGLSAEVFQLPSDVLLRNRRGLRTGDDSEIFIHPFGENLKKSLSLSVVCYFRGNRPVLSAGCQYREAPRKAQIGRKHRFFGFDRIPRNLHRQFLPFPEIFPMVVPQAEITGFSRRKLNKGCLNAGDNMLNPAGIDIAHKRIIRRLRQNPRHSAAIDHCRGQEAAAVGNHNRFHQNSAP